MQKWFIPVMFTFFVYSRVYNESAHFQNEQDPETGFINESVV